MALIGEILGTWRRPRAAMRARMDGPPEEGRALAVLMSAAGLLFVAQWPALARAAAQDPSIPLDARLAGALMATIFILPLLAYGTAGLSHGIARLMGGRGSGWRARVALFWALLAVAPLMLVQGIASGLTGPEAWLSGLRWGLRWVAGGLFLFIWLAGLRVAEFERT